MEARQCPGESWPCLTVVQEYVRSGGKGTNFTGGEEGGGVLVYKVIKLGGIKCTRSE